MQDFRELKVWRKSHELTLSIYQVARGFPRDELYGLTGQARRASVSIAANIAEGCCRSGDPEFRRFLQISMGSASELEYCLLLARDLRFLDEASHSRISTDVREIKRMLASLIRKLGAGNTGR